MGETGEGDQDVRTSSYKSRQSQGGSVQHGDYCPGYCTANLKGAKKLNLQSSHQKKNFLVTLRGDRQ